MKMNHYLNVPGLLRRFAKIGLALLLVLSVAFGAGAQDVSPARVSGTVVDQQGMPVVGAGVVVRGTQTGSVTDLDGRFTVMAAKDATLTVSFIGYTTREVPVGTQTDIRIVLEENVQSIDDVVVVGFGTQKKETVTGAIGQLSGKELMRSPVTNISNALVGRIAGMAAVQKTGEAGFEESTIRVRGVGTYAGDQNPLIVIDGIVRDMTAFNMLDPNDVENVNVLKDASATAVYGVRGANGVIIVTTKRGREGNLKISFTANVGFTSPTTLPSLVNSYDYAVLRNEAFANDGKPDDIKVFSQDELWKFRHNRDYTPSEVEAMGHLSPEQKQALLDSPAIYYGSTDYMKRIFDAGVSPQQQYSVNISGGTEKVAFFTSVGYSNQKSLTNDFGFSDAASNSGSHKYNFRTNFDFNIIPLTEINVSLSGQVRETKIITDRNSSVDMWGRYRDLMLNIYEAPPFSAPGVSDGRIITDYAGGTIMDSNKGAWGKSPIAYMLEKAQARINQSSLNTSIRIRHRMDYLVEGLSVRGALSYDHYFTKTLRVAPNLPVYSITRNPADPAELLYYGGEHNAKSYEETGWGKNRKVYVEAGIDFSRDFGKHAVTAMALVTGERYTSPGLKYNVPRGYYGVVGRVTYGYDQRYLAEFNMGYNGSENFAPGKRFGFFPAVSVGWVVSNEPYFPKNDILTWLKFRASYGQTGNSEIGGDRFLFLPGTWGSHSYGPWNGTPLDGYFFGSSNGSVNNPAFPGKYEQSTGNPDVTWEKKESYNIAAEVRMFRDRLSVTVDLFEEKRNNILTKLGVTPGIIGLSGSALPPVNVGRMSNRGYEIQVSWRDNVGTDFWYEVGGQVSYAVNKIDYKAEPSYMYAWMNETGFAYGQYKAYYNEGFYNTPEEVANHPYNAIDGNAPISRDELIAIMGALVGGWPETGMSDRLTVRLSGRIDRLEHRRTADGREQVRLIDYKTGKVPNGRSLFSDLQLVCYQLGLAFPEHDGKRGAQAIATMPDITQSALFHVMEYAAPAPRKGQGDEAYHQQALFAGGSINAGDFIPRKYVPKMASVFTSGLDDVERPAQVSEEHWKQLLESRSKMTVWSLTMISRVFYAAAASRATRITARPTVEHVGYCRTYGSGVCPACQGEQNTVFERTVA